MKKAFARIVGYFFDPYYSVTDCIVLLAVGWFFIRTDTWFAWVIFPIWRTLVVEIQTRIALRRQRRFRR